MGSSLFSLLQGNGVSSSLDSVSDSDFSDFSSSSSSVRSSPSVTLIRGPSSDTLGIRGCWDITWCWCFLPLLFLSIKFSNWLIKTLQWNKELQVINFPKKQMKRVIHNVLRVKQQNLVKYLSLNLCFSLNEFMDCPEWPWPLPSEGPTVCWDSTDTEDPGVTSGDRGVEGDDWLRLQTEETHVTYIAITVTHPHLPVARVVDPVNRSSTGEL